MVKKSIGAQPLVYPTPVFLVASYAEDGSANVMNAAWGGLCSSNPPSVAVSIRPQRQSYANILARKAFSVNIPASSQAVAADFFGLVSGRDYDKLALSGMTTERAEHVDAPVLTDCPVVVECRLSASHEIGVHTQLVGEIIDVKVDEHCFDSTGQPDIRKVDPLLFAPGNRAYFTVGDFVGKAFAIGKKLIP